MMVRNGKLSLVALSLAALGFASAPMGAQGQDNPPGGNEGSTISNKVVKLDLESADLYYALKLMFSQIKADFALPPDLRGTLITVRLNQPFRIALETVLKASGLPLTWKLENGVYSIIPIETNNEPMIDRDPNEPDTTEQPRNLPVRLRVNNVSGIDIVAILGGKFIPWTGSGQFVGFNPFGGGGGGLGGGGLGGGGLGGGLGGGGLGGGFGGGGLGGGGLGGGFGGGFGGGRGY